MVTKRATRLMRRLAVGVVIVVVVALIVGGGVEWFRPLPGAQLRVTSLRVPGIAPRMPWPSTGEAALSVPGLGNMGDDRGNRPVPAGVLSGVLTAYVILKDHPLSVGGDPGPVIKVSAQTLAAYRAGVTAKEPEVPVVVGESLSELDALEGLLVDSGSDMATLLANWDAGNASAFVEKMDHDARSLGLQHTRITKPVGTNDAMISSPRDLLRLAQAAMEIPVFRQIVSLGEIDLPHVGLQYNPNFALADTGVIGIEVGSDTDANGCYLFAAHKNVDGRTLTLYGVVLGQNGARGPNTAAVDAGEALVKTALSVLTALPIPAGRVVGQLTTAWGASTSVETSETVKIPAWPHLGVIVTATLSKITFPVAAGTRVGWLQIHQGTHLVKVALRGTTELQSASWFWRVTR